MLTGTGANLTYTPALGYSGPDSFTFRANDGTVDSNLATVSVTVTPVVPAAPTAGSDSATTREDAVVEIDVRANDTGVGTLTLAVTVAPANGDVVCTTRCTYTPDRNFNGTDRFTYSITDSVGQIATATVTITVTPVNDPPVAVGDSTTVQAGAAPITVPVLDNDLDVDDDTLSLVSATADRGTVTVRGNVLEYTAPTTAGPATVTYEISDGRGGTASAIVRIDVTGTTPPVECYPDKKPKCQDPGGGGGQPPTTASVHVASAYVYKGEPVVVTAKGLCATQDVTFVLLRAGGILWDPAVTASVTVPVANGQASTTFSPGQIPGGPGAFVVYAKQYGCGIVVATSVVVKATASAATSGGTTGAAASTVLSVVEPAPQAAPGEAPAVNAAPATPAAPAAVAVDATKTGPYRPVVPRRLLESRADLTTTDGLSNDIGMRSAGSVTAVQVTGRGGVPSDASAAVLNITVTEPTGPGSSRCTRAASNGPSRRASTSLRDDGRECRGREDRCWWHGVLLHIEGRASGGRSERLHGGRVECGGGDAGTCARQSTERSDGRWPVQRSRCPQRRVGDRAGGCRSRWCARQCVVGRAERDRHQPDRSWFRDRLPVRGRASDDVERELHRRPDRGEPGHVEARHRWSGVPVHVGSDRCDCRRRRLRGRRF